MRFDRQDLAQAGDLVHSGNEPDAMRTAIIVIGSLKVTGTDGRVVQQGVEQLILHVVHREV